MIIKAQITGQELRDKLGLKDGQDSIIPGPKGDRGEKGARGETGKTGKDSTISGPKGEQGNDGANGQAGKDGSPDKPTEIRDKLETLKKDERLDVSAIKGLDDKHIKLTDSIINRAIGIVDQRTSFLINKVSASSERITNLENRDALDPSTYIPYTGATTDVNLGTHTLGSGAITSTGLLGVTVASGYAATFMGGNVGIGTTSPSQMLTVGNNNQFTVSSIGAVVNAGETVNGVLNIKRAFEGIAALSAVPNGDFNMGNSGGTTLNMGTNSSGYAWIQHRNQATGQPGYPLALNPLGGNVGIGTTGPISALNVAGTTGLTWGVGANSLGLVTIGTGSASNAPGGGSLFVNTPSYSVGSTIYNSGLGIDGSYDQGTNYSTINIKAFGVQFAGYGSNLTFSTTNGTAVNEAMRINKSGNVGIGITSPTAVLHLKASQAGANLASLKIDAGVVATTPVTGNIESDGTHLYWTDSGGTRRQLDN